MGQSRKITIKSILLRIGIVALLVLRLNTLVAQSQRIIAIEMEYGTVYHFQSALVPAYYKLPTDSVPTIAARPVSVWIPKSKPTTFSRALWMMDGQNLFIDSWAFGGTSWGVDQAMGQYMKNHPNAPNTMVVGVWNSPNRFGEYAPEDALKAYPSLMNSLKSERKCKFSGNYFSQYLTQVLRPWVYEQLKVKTPRTELIGGSSMGGIASLYALSKYPYVWKGVMAFSTHWPLTLSGNKALSDSCFNAYYAYLRLNLKPATLNWLISSELQNRLWSDCGTLELDAEYAEYHQQFSKWEGFKSQSNNVHFEVFEGYGHNERAWRQRLPKALDWLLMH